MQIFHPNSLYFFVLHSDQMPLQIVVSVHVAYAILTVKLYVLNERLVCGHIWPWVAFIQEQTIIIRCDVLPNQRH